MRTFTPRRQRGSRGFTLVELLVVIGIIALLISILLPALNRARRQAATAQCSSNMRQIAMAVLQYTYENKQHFIPSQAAASTAFPNGWFWSNELVHQGFIKTANVYQPAGTTANLGLAASSVFRCPECSENTAGSTSAPEFPTNVKNNFGYALSPDKTDPTAYFGVPTWYSLVCANLGGSNTYGLGTRVCPFVYFNSATEGTAPYAGQPSVSSPYRQRFLGQIKRSAEMVMMCEGFSNNITTGGGPGNLMPRLGARHGQKTADGQDAWTNLAFFDGHVALYSTQPISQAGADNLHNETIFYLNNQ